MGLPEHVVLDEEGISRGLEDKVLHKGLRGIIISLKKKYDECDIHNCGIDQRPS